MTDEQTLVADTFYVENLDRSVCTFSNSSGKFRLEPHGLVGSLSEINRRIAHDPFVKRAESRGKVRILTAEQAVERMEELEVPDYGDDNQLLSESLGADASSRVSRYRRQDLPEEAESRRAVPSDKVWNGEGQAEAVRPLRPVATARPVNQHPGIVEGLESETAFTQPELDVSKVMGPRERQEGWNGDD